MKERKAEVERRTGETYVKVSLNLDGEGKAQVKTTYPFLDHMLSLFSYHGLFDLEVLARGDTQVDYHHLVEDVGICLGKAVRNALGEKRGIKRYGNFFVPMDEVLVQVTMDISGRPLLVFNLPSQMEEEREFELTREFFRSFSSYSGITLHINLHYGRGYHHVIEAIFKAFGLSLEQATRLNERRKGVPSTKGMLEGVELCE